LTTPARGRWYLLSNFDMELVGDLPKPNYEARPAPPASEREREREREREKRTV